MFEMHHPIVDLGIVCSDFEKSLHFYRDLLEMEVVFDIEIPASTAVGAGLAPTKFRQVRLQAGKTLIKLMEIENPPPSRSFDFQAGVRWLTFILPDVHGTVAKLKENGVEFMTDPVSAPDSRYVVCAKAPDGLLIELVQLYDEDM